MGMKLNKAKRLAAGHMCLALFHLTQSGVVHPLRQLTNMNHEGLGPGLTENEREYVRRLTADLHDKGEILRKLGWRLLRGK